MRVATIVGAATWLGLGAFGCALRHEDPEVKPIAITVAFPAEQDAFRMDTVQILVFEPDVHCAQLVQQLVTEDPNTPRPVAGTPFVSLCSFIGGNITLDAPLGPHTLVAQAARDTKNVVYFTGCVEQTLGEGDAPLPIQLSRSDDLSHNLPSSSCASLADFCAKRCE